MLKHSWMVLWALIGTAAAAAPIPEVVTRDGRSALMVDGAPYLVLGAQVNNSSAWASMLPKVWPAVRKLGANTVSGVLRELMSCDSIRPSSRVHLLTMAKNSVKTTVRAFSCVELAKRFSMICRPGGANRPVLLS